MALLAILAALIVASGVRGEATFCCFVDSTQDKYPQLDNVSDGVLISVSTVASLRLSFTIPFLIHVIFSFQHPYSPPPQPLYCVAKIQTQLEIFNA